MTTAKGTFEVLGGKDDAIDELDGGVKLTHASGTQSFTGDIVADGAVDWLMLHRSDRTARFVGIQRVSGTVGDRRGTLALTADGDHDGTGSKIALVIVEGSGTADLTGISGSGTMTAPGGRTGTYELEYRLEA